MRRHIFHAADMSHLFPSSALPQDIDLIVIVSRSFATQQFGRRLTPANRPRIWAWAPIIPSFCCILLQLFLASKIVASHSLGGLHGARLWWWRPRKQQHWRKQNKADERRRSVWRKYLQSGRFRYVKLRERKTYVPGLFILDTPTLNLYYDK